MIGDQSATAGGHTSSGPKPPEAKSTSNLAVRITLLIALVVLVLVMISVIWVLPRYIDEATVPLVEAPTAQIRSTAPPPTEAQTLLAREKRQAERALGEFLQRQALWEGKEIATWGGEQYEQVLRTLAAADAAFANGDFELAKTKYTTASAMLSELEASRPERLQASLQAAATALTDFDAAKVQHHYQIALALEPQNEEALKGLKRAATLPQLAALLAQAGEAERLSDWPAAQEFYEQAVTLDPQSNEARQGLAQVSAQLEDVRFRTLMSNALAATQNGQFESAREALSDAGKLRPDAPDVRDAEQRLRLAIQQSRISAHRRRAETFVQQERWQEAAEEYDAALAIDAQAQFALHGRRHSKNLAALHGQLGQYLMQPERLHSVEPRANARALLQTLRGMADKGPRLAQKEQDLERIMELAETPVMVQLLSDEETEVRIDRVGELGRFKQSTVALLPGNYVVRGNRVGYRDVRLELVVQPGATASPLVVKCREKI